MKNILTIDVEDWFHILDLQSTPDVTAWGQLENRLRTNFLRLLDECDEAGVRSTCFFLGWVAENSPDLVREAAARGHEIASHSYAHQLVYTQTRREFAEDLRRSKMLLEDVSGAEVIGYRAPGFSITEETPWAFEEILAAGYSYDSSIFPTRRGHGGLPGAQVTPHLVRTESGDLVEMPITVARLAGQRLCLFGGGYLRLTPYNLMCKLARQVNEEGRPVIYFVHPREIDPEHPRLSMGPLRAFKAYVNLHTTMPKLRRLLSENTLLPMRDWICEHARIFAARDSDVVAQDRLALSAERTD